MLERTTGRGVEHATPRFDLLIRRDTAASVVGTYGTDAAAVRAREGAVRLDTLASRLRCRISLGPGGTVALDAVDSETATRRPLVDVSPTDRPSATPKRQRTPRKHELSLVERLLLVLQPPLDLLLEPAGPLEWPAPLYPYQREGVATLVERDALLLADDMGLGKTIQAIAAVRVLTRLRRISRVLVVAPASLLSQWSHELKNWAPELRATVVRGGPLERQRLWRTPSHVFAVSYETLRQDVVADPDNLRQPEEIEWDVVILDEAQKIKNQRTTAAQVCKRLKRRASWALTGTPLENDLNDLLSIIDFLTPLPGGVYDDVFERQASLQLRRRKADVLQDLPPKSVFDLWLQLHPQQRRTYERVEQEGVVDLRQRGRSVTITHVLALIQRLKQVCNVCPETGASAKLEDLADRLGEIAAEGQRALVFSQYVDSEYGVGGIVQRLDDLNPLAYHGGLSAREKDAVIAMFKGSDEHKALVLSLRAGGQGLNLQEASYVVHFDRWWNPAVERQAEDRAHRLGQDSAVTVYRYICEGTIEERIDRILREKQQLFDQYVDQVSIDPGKLLGEKEIFGLFGLEPPPRAARPAIEELPA
jgi:SNF2 family DNA or RNA helicase